MAIRMSRAHQLPREQARQIVDRVARELQQDLGLSYTWENNLLRFQRMGIQGHIEVLADCIEVFIQKSFLVPISEHWLKEQVTQYLDRHFPDPST